jgi:hypothetical protein
MSKSIKKAHEDKLLSPEKRQGFRQEKRAFGDDDELESQMMPREGVSVAGIEARRANPKDQSYIKVGSSAQHKSRAKEMHRRIIDHIKSMNPNLPKTELKKGKNFKLKDYHDIKGVHTSGGFSGLEETGQSQAGRSIKRAKEPQPNKYLSSLYHERGKQTHRDILNALQNMPKANLPKSEGLDKAKNVREQKKKVFGIQSRPSGVMREKHMQAIKEFFERRYGIPSRVTPGKLNIAGKFILKPSWKTGNIEYEPNPEAAVHEGGHFEQIPEGVTMEEHQAQMDRNFGIANKKYGYLSGKQTQFEIQPMAAENLLRRRMGLPATKIGHPAKESDPQRIARDTGTPSAIRAKTNKNAIVDLIRQSRLLSPENRERTEMIDTGEMKYEPGVGMIPGSSIDAIINQRARAAVKDPSRKDIKTLLRNENTLKDLFTDLKKADLSIVQPSGVKLGTTSSGKDIFSHGMVGEHKDFSSRDHKEAARLHQTASNSSRNLKMKQHHNNKAKLHSSAAINLEAKVKSINPKVPYVEPSESGKLFDPDLSGKVHYKSENKKTSVGPSIVTEPLEINRVTRSGPITISGPNVIQGNDKPKMKRSKNG